MPGLEVTDTEIAREVETLRSLRRRSVTGGSGPGALAIDPDLPPSLPSSPSASPITPYSSNDDVTLSLASPDGLGGADAGLFWVPAHLHPELAPGEFRAFLKAHTVSDPDDPESADNGGHMGPSGVAGDAPGLARSPSWLARSASRRNQGGLGRKQSMLSRQYRPSADDRVEEEAPPLPLGMGTGASVGLGSGSMRRSGSLYQQRGQGPGLTLQDLQKMELVMDKADETPDPEGVRQLLRRSLSLNKAPGFLQDDVPLSPEDESSPSLPRPGSIIRRSAHTKIRKASLAGDGGGRRFAASRKGRTTAAPQIEIPGIYDDDNVREGEDGEAGPSRRVSGSDESEEVSRESESISVEDHSSSSLQEQEQDDDGIFDAYRNSRSSSASSEYASQDESAGSDRSPTSISGSRGRASRGEREKLSLPFLRENAEAGWYSGPNRIQGHEQAQGQDGDKTPTQESAKDPLAGYRRPSPSEAEGYQEARPGPPADALDATPRPAGLRLEVPEKSAWGSGQTTEPSPQSALVSPHVNFSPARTSPTEGLPPGMAPPQLRSAVPPGIAAQQQQAQQQQQQQQQHRQSIVESPTLLSPASSSPVSPSIERPQLTRTTSNASAASVSSSTGREKDNKEKKSSGLFGKKDKKDKTKSKDSFLGSLFGSKKKVEEERVPVSHFGAAGPAAAAALLGASKSKAGVSPSPSPTSPAFNSYARYPIHVERAVYRLSHIKLANARRPLYEQVLISNLMFWYLGVIGRNVQEEKKNATGSAGSGTGAGAGAEGKGGQGGKADEEKEQTVKAKGTPPKPVDSGSAGVALPHRLPDPVPSQQREKKMGLTKPDRRRDEGRGRDAEAPVRQVSYGMQGAQVESEMRSMGMRAGPGPGPATGQGGAAQGTVQGRPQGQQYGQPPHSQQPYPPQHHHQAPPQQQYPGQQQQAPHQQQPQQQQQQYQNPQPPAHPQTQPPGPRQNVGAPTQHPQGGRALSPPSSRPTSDYNASPPPRHNVLAPSSSTSSAGQAVPAYSPSPQSRPLPLAGHAPPPGQQQGPDGRPIFDPRSQPLPVPGSAGQGGLGSNELRTRTMSSPAMGPRPHPGSVAHTAPPPRGLESGPAPQPQAQGGPPAGIPPSAQRRVVTDVRPYPGPTSAPAMGAPYAPQGHPHPHQHPHPQQQPPVHPHAHAPYPPAPQGQPQTLSRPPQPQHPHSGQAGPPPPQAQKFSHAGPQPGEIFRLPPGAAAYHPGQGRPPTGPPGGVQPGQIFNPSATPGPGQIYRPMPPGQPQAGYPLMPGQARPPMVVPNGYPHPGHPGQQPYPHPQHAHHPNGLPPGPQRLPHPPPQGQHRAPPQGATSDAYDPRRGPGASGQPLPLGSGQGQPSGAFYSARPAPGPPVGVVQGYGYVPAPQAGVPGPGPGGMPRRQLSAGSGSSAASRGGQGYGHPR